MDDFIRGAFTLLSAKLLTIISSVTMAGIAVGLDAKRHSFPSAVLAIFAGTVVGVISATSICALMGFDERVGYGISAVAAVSANNLIKWLLRTSEDPLTLWQRFRGGKSE